ncbi:methionyl-tRNA formyltransferase [Alkalihalophilus marmarensis]|uniref:Methionyl-tRNA formyltransferase n=1 Tax=Alkalihalophilus marmarensis DSM 21297 TaxID=1188261 RepID=U6SP72_9BACI|nr:methionyl-tRNA formyltransferase [Alkalihalophilus marmarensis]ERN53187.1 methionyl-tRNA formyltransferase [Alkalihalophilus marmarensis DSM 21297]MCM3489633.1 methionyl-tRNA formyltransferase [Alkalihalophilus marmarensis]
MKIVFMGTPDFSVPVLRQLVMDGYNIAACITQPDRLVGRKKVMTPPPVKVEAMKHGIPVLQPERIRNQEEIERVLGYEPELVVTAAYGQILPNDILEKPAYGCINVHASLLPKYRGGAPIHQSIIDGEKETGITIMYMVEKLDAGDMLTQVRVPILEEDHVGSMHDKLSAAGAKLLSETIPALIKGEITPQKQDETKVTFARNITREMEKMDWSKTGEELYNQVRGLNPWPVAFTTLQQKPLKVWWAKKVNVATEQEPGTVIEIRDDSFVVATGNQTALEIMELQPSGKKRMTAEDFLRGAGSSLEIGMKLGDENE